MNCKLKGRLLQAKRWPFTSMLTIRHLATGLYRRSYLANFAHQAYCIYKTNEPDKPHEPYAPLLQKHTKPLPLGRSGGALREVGQGFGLVWVDF